MKKNQPKARKTAKGKKASAKPSGTAGGKAAGGGDAGAGQSDARSDAAAPVIEGRAEETGRKQQGTNPFDFIQQVRAEGSKITWTSRNETLISTIMVLIMVLVMVVFFFVVDQSLRFGICNLLPINCTGGN